MYPGNDGLRKLIWVREGEYVGLDYTGKDFWIGFMRNYDNGPSKIQKLFITSAFGASVSIELPKLGWSTSIYVPENGVVDVLIPNIIAGEETGTHKHNQNSPTGIHVQSDEPVSVYGVSTIQYTSDAYLAIPYRTIGASYVVSAPMGIYNTSDFITGSPLIDAPAEIMVVGAEDSTKVYVVSPAAIEGFQAGDTIEFVINKGEARVLMGEVGKALGGSISTVDLSGARVWANKRFSMFGGAQCAMVPGIMNVAERCDACDHLIEQIPAKASLGSEFYLTDFNYKLGKDIVRVIAGDYPTEVNIQGAMYTLDANTPFLDHKFEGELEIKTDKPAFVTQLCTGGNCLPMSPTDPFMMNILPKEQWGKIYTFTTPIIQKFNLHFINVIKSSPNGRVSLDGTMLNPGLFKQVAGTAIYAAKMGVSRGAHMLTGDSTFSVYSYGFGYAESYGYPASGGLLDPLSIDSLELLASPIHPPCLGDAKGEIDLTVFGGIPPYSFLWSNGDSIEDIKNLVAGTYTVTVLDDTGLSLSLDVEIIDPPGTVWDKFATDLLCFEDSSGTAEVDTLAGNGPLTMLWDDGVVLFERVDLAAGEYPFQILDKNLCVVFDTVLIEQPNILKVEIDTDSVSCFGGSDGEIAVSIVGGTLPYNVVWNAGASGETLSSQPQGNYTFSLLDLNNCPLDSNAFIYEPEILTWSVDHIDESCTGNGDGEITFTRIAGGIEPYQKQVDGQLLSTSSIDQLSSGTYAIAVTDFKGCPLDSSVVLLEDHTISATEKEVVPSNCDKSNARLVVEQSSGPNGNGTFVWEGVAGGENGILEDIPGGLWYYYQLDDSPCVLKDSVFVPKNDPLLIDQLVVENTSCGLDNGEAEVFASGDVGPYQYWWYTNPSSYSKKVNELAEGQYVIVVYSANCVIDSVVQINEGPSLTIDYFAEASSCGGNSGSVSLNVSGGSGLYNYDWLEFPGINASVLTNLAGGFYTVIVDDGQCQQEATIEIQNVAAPELNVSSNATSCGLNNGAINMYGVGGNVGNYTYFLNGNVVSNDVPDLAPGVYQIRLSDGTCEVFAQQAVLAGPNMQAVLIDQENSSCGETNGRIGVRVLNSQGPLTIEWDDVPDSTLTRTGLSSGLYAIKISDDLCSDSLSAEVGNDDGPGVVSDFVHPSCNLDNGWISVQDTAGQNLSFSWNTGHTDDLIENLKAGTYFVVVSNGVCDQVLRFNLEDIGQPNLVLDSLIPERCDSANAQVMFHSEGGSGQEYMFWNNTPVAGSPITGISGGQSVWLKVEDNGCYDSLLVNVPVVVKPELNLSQIVQQHCYEQNGIFVATGSLGSGNYLFSLENGPQQDSGRFENVAPGLQHVAMFDGYCWELDSLMMDAIPPILISDLSIDSSSCGLNNGTATITVQNTLPYQVLWNGVQGANMHQTSGDFQVVVVDQYCSDTLDGSIPAIPNLEVSLTDLIPMKCDIVPGQATLVPNQYSAPLTITWDGVNGSTQNSNLQTGSHSIFVQDKNCDTTIQFFVEHLVPEMEVLVAPDSCNGNFGSVAISYADFTGDVETRWDGSPINTLEITNLGQGQHLVQVEDEVGCILESEVHVENIHFSLYAAFIDVSPVNPEPKEWVEFSASMPDRWNLWYWEFGNGSASNEINPRVRFEEKGFHSAKYFAEHELGCVDSLEIRVKIESQVHIYLPSSFTPNGDGFNDVFFPKTYNVIDLKGQVFNRWGEEIFEYKSLNDAWNGTYKGIPSPVGTYALRFVFTDINKEVHEVFGKVTLVR
ncbi:MAG: gliding motility-associated-like protein [Sphingobacteriales bacterium]|jgi:gliding motility-associated-like protein